jgi:hypothetical protein
VQRAVELITYRYRSTQIYPGLLIKPLHVGQVGTKSATFYNMPTASDKSIKPLFVYEDEDGTLFVRRQHTQDDFDHLDFKGVLDDVTLWAAYMAAGDAYMVACHAHHKAARVVLSNLRQQALSTSVLPTPTSDEIQALAYFYVRDRLRASRQINMTICALRDLRDPIEPTQEMVKVLHSKGWISFDFFTLARSGEEQCLRAAEINDDKKED